MKSNEKGLFIYNGHPPVNTAPYSGVLAPTFIFLMRSYLPHRPATAGSFKDQPVRLTTAQMITVKKTWAVPDAITKMASKQFIGSNSEPLWTLGVLSYQFSWAVRILFAVSNVKLFHFSFFLKHNLIFRRICVCYINKSIQRGKQQKYVWGKKFRKSMCQYVDFDLAAAAKSLQSCPTLCDPIDGSPPGSPIPGILQARTLEWVAISFLGEWLSNKSVL